MSESHDPFLMQLHPSLREGFEKTRPPPDDLPLETRRRMIREAAFRKLPKDFVVEQPPFELNFGLWIFRDPAPNPRRLLIWYHGGGFTTGVPEMEMEFLLYLSKCADCDVLSLDYPLGPEYQHPEALEFGFDALKKIHILKPDALLAVGGVSAGGTLAAATAIRAVKYQVPLRLQLPLYGCFHKEPLIPKRRSWVDDYRTWNRFAAIKAWDMYAGNRSSRSELTPSSASWHQLMHVAPACMMVGSEDVLALENMDYARTLHVNGVNVSFRLYRGGYHSFEQLQPEATLSQKAREYIAVSLRDAFEEER